MATRGWENVTEEDLGKIRSPKQRTAESMLQRADDPEREARFEKALAGEFRRSADPLLSSLEAAETALVGLRDKLEPQQRTQALGRLPAGRMNNTEKKYAARLETLKHAGEIIWWAFEPINIRLAPNCYYRVDFMVMLASGEMECHETKGGGGFTDDSLVKIKVAATLLPFRFISMQFVKGEWIERTF